jgi:hypothetical protein
MIRILTLALLLVFPFLARAQEPVSLIDRIAALESAVASTAPRLASLEAKVDALGAKIDALMPVATLPPPAPAARGYWLNGVFVPGAGSVAAPPVMMDAGACGSASGGMMMRLRIRGGRRGGCG